MGMGKEGGWGWEGRGGGRERGKAGSPLGGA